MYEVRFQIVIIGQEFIIIKVVAILQYLKDWRSMRKFCF